MRMKRLSIVFLWILCVGIFCAAPYFSMAQNTDIQHIKDSLRNVIPQLEGKEKMRAYSQLSFIYMSEVSDERKMDTLLMLFDEMDVEARLQGNLTQQGIIRGNILISFKSRGMFDEVIRRAPEYLDFMAENGLWRIYYQACISLIDSYRIKGEYEQTVNEARKVYEKAKEQNDSGGMGIALYSIAVIYNSQERWADAEKYFRECIEILKDNNPYLNILTQSYAYLCATLRMQKRYDDAMSLAPEFEKAVHRFEQESRSPQPTAWSNFYTAYMYIYLDSGEYDKAEIYCGKLESAVQNRISQYDILRTRALILEARKQYSGALAKLDSALLVTGDEDKITINELHKIKMRILMQTGRVDEGNQLFEQILEMQKAIHDLDVNAKFDEIRTQYEVDKHIAEKERTRNHLLLTFVCCLLLFTGLLIIVILYRQKQLTYRELVRKSRQWADIRETENTKSTENEPDSDEQNGDSTANNKSGNTDVAIMEEIERLMKEKKMYADTDISLDKLSAALGFDRRIVSGVINRRTHKNFFAYINEHRIKEAVRIMSEPDSSKFTIDGIAAQAGFNDRKTFHRVFKQYTGLTPAAFRSNT